MTTAQPSPLSLAAREYAARGWCVFPLKPRSKVPLGGGHGVRDATADSTTVHAWWAEHPQANVGLACGAGSGVVVLDVDGNAGEASLRELEAQHGALPPTATARTGGGGRHLYFAHPGRSVRNRVRLRPGLDFRGDGGYVVAPPSIHELGTAYAWEAGPTPLAPAPAWLLKLLDPPRLTPRSAVNSAGLKTHEGSTPYVEAALRAECEGVARAPQGARNDTLNLAGFSLAQLVGGGLLKRERVQAELRTANEHNPDPLPSDEVERTLRSAFDAGEKNPRGIPEPRRRFVDRDGAYAARVFVVEGERIALADEAQGALAADPVPRVYVRARQLVRVIRDCGRSVRGIKRPRGAPVIQALSLDALRDRLARLGRWEKTVDKRSSREVLPPEWLVRNILARDSWPFPTLEGVIEAPTMRADGSLLDRPGFDDETGLLYEPSGAFPAVPDQPTALQVRSAVLALLDPLADFPFRDDSDRSAAIAAVLSLVGRYAIDGPVPMFAVGAPTPGTGKSLLADVVSTVGTGRPAARTTPDDDDSETKKRLIALALEGAAVVLLDNVDGRLGSKSLASALTGTTWKGRLLGENANVEAPLRAVWLATGNNIGFRGDLGRRVVPIGMTTDQEYPEDRPAEGFKYPKLLEHVARVRPQLVAAALTILRGYHLAGRPAHGRPGRMGTFEAWDELIRGACVWAALADPIAGRERIRADDDTDRRGLGGALEACVEAFGIEPFTAATAAERAEKDTALRDALLELAGGDKLDGRRIGYALRNVRGRVVGRMRFEASPQTERKHGTTRWRVERA
jgi:hypothetical protein